MAERRSPFSWSEILAMTLVFVVVASAGSGLLPRTEIGFLPGLFLFLLFVALLLGRKWFAVAGAIVLAAVGYRLRTASPQDMWQVLVLTVGFLGAGYFGASLRDARLAGEATRRSWEEKFKQLVDKSLAGIFVYRGDRVLYANSRFIEIVGVTPEEVIGKSYWDFIYEKDRETVRRIVARREAEGATDLRYECRLTAKDGRTVWVEVVSSPAEYEGQPAILVSVYNITDRKETEEQRRELSKLAHKQEEQLVHSTRLAEMGEMAAGVAHELNQPLTGIKNFARNAAYMLEEGVGNLDEVKENLRLISGQVDRASKIISQMRELARRTERHLVPVDINNTLRESVAFVMPQLRLSGVEVALSLDPQLPEVTGDRIRLEQVFLNLLTNARHAMEETPERRLEVRTRHEAQSTWPVVIEIADTGKGFSPEVAGKLFTPFFSTKKASHGTGLGLSISLGIVKDHQGTIEAAGTEGEGATFTVRLPARQQ